MPTAYKYQQILGATLIGFAALSAGNSYSAGRVMNAQGDYLYKELLWSKISGNAYTYQKAAEICNAKPTSAGGVKWRLPTAEQMKDFYLNVAMKKLGKRDADLKGWNLGRTWTSTKVADNHYEAPDLNTGDINWDGQQDNRQFLVACVFPYDTGNTFLDDKLIWSKIAQDAPQKTVAEAAKYCDDMARGNDANVPWRLPTLDELKAFYSKKGNIATLENSGWKLGMTWSSTTRKSPPNSTVYHLFNLKYGREYGTTEDDRGPLRARNYVTCVR